MIDKSPHNGKEPQIHPSAFIAKNAVVIGDVIIGEGANIWFSAVIRGDVGHIEIGKNTSIQENCTVHAEEGETCIIGDNCIVGHNAMVHGPCTVGDDVLVGISSVILQGSNVKSGCVVGAGAVVRGDTDANSLYVGIPAKKKKDLGSDSPARNRPAALGYAENGKKFKDANLGHD